MSSILSVRATDFCLFEEIKLVLRGKGLIWISGDNQDSDSADSNGAGKSALFKAIGWGLYGEAIDGVDGDRVIRHGTKCATVIIAIRSASERWTVTRTRRKAQPRLKLECGDEEWKGSGKEIQEQINRLMGMNWTTFRNTALYGQNDRKRFTSPDVSDTDRKELLHSILNSEILERCHEHVKLLATALKREGDTVQADIDKLKARIAEHDLDALQARFDDWEESRTARAARLVASSRELVTRARAAAEQEAVIQELRDKLAAIPKPAVEAAEAAWETAQAKTEAAREKQRDARGVLDMHKRGVHAANERLADLEGDKCPTCTTPLTEGVAHEHVDRLRAQLRLVERAQKLAADALKERTDAVTAALEAEVEANAAVTAARAAARKRAEISEQISEAEADALPADALVAQAKEKTAEARAVQEEDNPHADQLAAAKTKVAGYRSEIKQHTERLEAINVDRAHHMFWVRGFSGQGLPSFLLDSVMPYITERANHYLSVLADGDITMSFSTQRELKSAKGEMRDQINIAWEIEGVEGYPPSGGQQKKMDIATDLALMDLVATREGAHPDILMLDEVLDGLDKEGRNRVSALLHELRKTRETILVISHDEDIAESFGRVVAITKRGGVASLAA